MAQDQGPSAWVRGAVWALGLSLGLIVSLGAVLRDADRNAAFDRIDKIERRLDRKYERIERIRSELSRLSDKTSRVMAQQDDHERTSDEWKARIVRNEDAIKNLIKQKNGL